MYMDYINDKKYGHIEKTCSDNVPHVFKKQQDITPKPKIVKEIEEKKEEEEKDEEEEANNKVSKKTKVTY